MLLKIVSLFLVFAAVLAMFGKLRWLDPRRARPERCTRCGAPMAGRSCPCGGRA